MSVGGINTLRGISSSMPHRDEIPVVISMFSWVHDLIVHILTSHNAPFSKKFNMAAVKPELLVSWPKQSPISAF
jgi:hypothetical protein